MIRTRRTATALTAAAALALGVVPAAFTTTSILAGGEEPTTLTPADDPFGTPPQLVLETGATNRVYLDEDVDTTWDTDERQESLSGSKFCELQSEEDLLAFTGTYSRQGSGDAASFSGGSIGVAEKKSGTSCYEVDASSGDVLTLTLGDLTAAEFRFDSARLDLDLKQSARVLATAYADADRDGVLEASEVVRTFELQSGASVGLPTDADEVRECPNTADSGPDSGDNDNCEWQIGEVGDGVVFDALKLAALVGSFSLEGGADGGDTRASVFRLAFGELCVGDRLTLDSTDSAPEATVTRIGNASSGASCVPYRFQHADQGAELLKGAGDDDAQFVFDFVWTVAADTSPGSDAALEEAGLVHRTTVDFDGELGEADLPTYLASCPDLTTTTVEVDGVMETFEVVAAVETNLNAPDLAALPSEAVDGIPGKQFACVVSQSIDPILGTDNVEVRERIYAFGDIVLRKP